MSKIASGLPSRFWGINFILFRNWNRDRFQGLSAKKWDEKRYNGIKTMEIH